MDKITDEQAKEAIGVASNPWDHNLKELTRAAYLLFHRAGELTGHPHSQVDRDFASMLVSVAQARTLRVATWTLVGVTFVLVIVTGVLAWATFRLG